MFTLFRRRDVQTGDNDELTTDWPWRRAVAKRSPRHRLYLTVGILLGLYVVNVTVNAIYKDAMKWQIDLLQDRAASLARLDPHDPGIARLQQLIARADYASLIEILPRAIAKRSAVTEYLKRHPHLVLGIAVDGDDYEPNRIDQMLRTLNRRLRPYRLSIGLIGPPIEIRFPVSATRDDILRGIPTAFRRRPDFVVALTDRRCTYSTAEPDPAEPARNRIYSFGRSGLIVVDKAVWGESLTSGLLTEIARFLTEETRERRWRPADYAGRPEEIVADHQFAGKLRRDIVAQTEPADGPRQLHISIGLDDVPPAEARAAIGEANAAFRSVGIRFEIRHLHPHRLKDRWKWPVEMKKMLARGDSDLYILLTASEWVSPDQGPVRGLANAAAGAMMIQVGTPSETAKRLSHELGHMFGLPHTLLNGHVMYPNEGGIGLRWSPGSKRLLAKNKQGAQWFSTFASPARFDIASRLAPVMRRATPEDGSARSLDAFAANGAWIRCD